MSSDSSGESGFSLCTVLFIVFLVLKLTGNITWSWWWVTSPLWIPVLFCLIVLAFVGVCWLAFDR